MVGADDGLAGSGAYGRGGRELTVYGVDVLLGCLGVDVRLLDGLGRRLSTILGHLRLCFSAGAGFVFLLVFLLVPVLVATFGTRSGFARDVGPRWRRWGHLIWTLNDTTTSAGGGSAHAIGTALDHIATGTRWRRVCVSSGCSGGCSTGWRSTWVRTACADAVRTLLDAWTGRVFVLSELLLDIRSNITRILC